MISQARFAAFFIQPLSRNLFVLAGLMVIFPFLYRHGKRLLPRKKSSREALR
jgi:hypothetical protein